MHNTAKRAFVLLGFVFAFLGGMAFLAVSFFMNGKEWATHRANGHIYSGGQISSAGAIYDSDDKILAQTISGKRHFNEDATVRKATLHAVGDTQGFMSTGVHSLYESELTGYNLFTGVYYLKKYGSGNDIYLTLNSDACVAAYKALNGRKGTVGVYNYKTGEIECMVSSPTYDPENKPDKETMDSEAYNGAYMNKFLSATYTPGSTFKVITAASAIENIPDIYSQSFTCKKTLDINGTDVVCSGYHGTLNFEKALNQSCNVAFAQIAIELGKNKLQKTAEELGVNSSYKIDRVEVAKGTIDLSNAVDIDMGWAGLGQYTTMVNPCTMVTIMGAIANGGKAIEPYYIKSIVNPGGLTTYKGSASASSVVKMNSTVASKLKTMLRSNVKDYYGDSSFPGLTMCGKTGTAEVGGKDTPDNALFVGFSEDTGFPYAVIVIIENAGSTGRQTAIPVANAVLQALK